MARLNKMKVLQKKNLSRSKLTLLFTFLNLIVSSVILAKLFGFIN